MYQWDKAMEIANSIEGWHLPTIAEWETLRDFVDWDITYLKSETEWDDSGNGTDNLGFGVIPAGYNFDGSYYDVGSHACFWTSDEYMNSTVYVQDFDTSSSSSTYNHLKTVYHSVRLIKDS